VFTLLSGAKPSVMLKSPGAAQATVVQTRPDAAQGPVEETCPCAEQESVMQTRPGTAQAQWHRHVRVIGIRILLHHSRASAEPKLWIYYPVFKKIM
jgi:hypothetical protein